MLIIPFKVTMKNLFTITGYAFYSYEIDQTDVIIYEASDGTIIQIPGAGKESN